MPSHSVLFHAVDPQNLTEIAILTRTIRVKFWKLNNLILWINTLNSPCASALYINVSQFI